MRKTLPSLLALTMTLCFLLTPSYAYAKAGKPCTHPNSIRREDAVVTTTWKSGSHKYQGKWCEEISYIEKHTITCTSCNFLIGSWEEAHGSHTLCGSYY